MNRPRPRTLVALALCLALLAAGVYTGVRWAQGSKGTVTLLASWTGREAAEFEERVVEDFEDTYGIDVVYQGSSALSQVLAADIAAGSPPDVVVVPGPGELLTYAADGRLRPLDGLFAPEQYDEMWAPRVPGRTGTLHTYWLPIKTSLKSMVWYTGDKPTAPSAGDPEKWCLGMEDGAASGWPGTDWIEDILLQQAGPEQYEKWVNGTLPWTHDDVREAWRTFGEMAGAGDRERAARLLTTGFGADCATTGRLEHQGSFRAGHWRAAGGDYVPSAEVIPGAGSDAGAWEVSGDLAALLTDNPDARQLIRHLADPATDLPDHTVNRAAAPGPGQDTIEARIDRTLREDGPTRCWDASDAMPRTLRDAFHQAVLRHLVEPDTLDDRLRQLQRLTTEQRLRVCGGGAP
ncbi:extracellular solute-binding protein [Streptomyces sp. NPDC052676]|uniref:extracellular solute-binding protein n=1 Tax=Streptomyces sp. NPDC052676 TaxID=3154953 RepID=UPI0034386909